MPIVILVLLLGHISEGSQHEVHGGMSRREVLASLLNDEYYDPRIPPDFEQDYPTNVTLQLHILNVDSINEGSLDYSINLYLRQQWTDPRLVFLGYNKSIWLELDTRMLQNVWVPDVYFRNEKKATFHNVTVPNRLLHIYRNGTVSYSLRLSLTLSCYMDLKRYPFDVQECPIILQSYTYTVDNVVFHWAPEDAISYTNPLNIPQFKFVGYELQDCTYIFENRFACIKADFKLEREFGFFLIQVYTPSTLIVILSWISFWIDIEAVPARISLGVLTVLTMTTQSAGAQASLPKVSYIKAVDIWMSTCMFFVFGALLEFAYVNVLSRRVQALRLRSQEKRRAKRELTPMADVANEPEDEIPVPRFSARQIDKVSRVVFPSLFSIFNIGYWSWYLIHFT
ncbi:glycine receptor subunit alpha-2-like [Gigantopelta aegis]|uniref:glycine receptor subunit alpha-2-like n=1 Tax=Gigantopelta aegis TaxID=1735272 RepID=UPI001B88903F|nr:glycine receptor subunit alpha-2-like [Gigantopelta aegis]